MGYPVTLRFDHILIPPGECLPCVSEPLPVGTAFHPSAMTVVCMNLGQTGHELPSSVDVERVYVGAEEQSFHSRNGALLAQNLDDPLELSAEISPVNTHQTVTIWAKNITHRIVRFLPLLHGVRE